MHLELQMTADLISAALLRWLRDDIKVPPGPALIPKGLLENLLGELLDLDLTAGDLAAVLLDHFEFGSVEVVQPKKRSLVLLTGRSPSPADEPLYHEEKGEDGVRHGIGIAVTVTPYVRVLELLGKPGGVPLPIGSFTVTYDVYLGFSGAEPRLPQLVYEFVEFDGFGIDGLLTKVLSPAFSQLNSQIPIDLSFADDLLGKDSFSNGALSASSDLEVASLRLEFLSLDNDVITRWQAFVSGMYPIHLAKADWAAFLSSDLLAFGVGKQLTKALEKIPDSKVEEAANATWTSVALSGMQAFGVNVDTCIEMMDACPSIFGDVDMSVYLPSRLGFALGQHPDGSGVALETLLRIEPTASDWDSFRCGAATGFVGGSLAGGVVSIGAIVLAIAGAVVGIMAVGFLVDDEDNPEVANDLDALGHCKNESPDPDAEILVRCHKPLALPAGEIFGTVVPSDLTTDQTGLTIRGVIETAKVLESDEPGISVAVNPSTWASNFSCSTKSLNTTLSPAEIQVTSKRPLHIGALSVLDDPSNAYNLQITQSWHRWTRIEVTGIAPFPAKVLIQTNRGIALVSCPVPGPNPQDDMTPGELKTAHLQGITSCTKLSDPFWNMTGRYNPLWSVDPPPVEVAPAEILHHWSLMIDGLVPGEFVSYEAGQTEGRIVADERGVAALNLVVTADAQVTLLRSSAGEPGHIGMRQQVLVRDATIRLPSPTSSVSFVREGLEDLLVMTDNRGRTLARTLAGSSNGRARRDGRSPFPLGRDDRSPSKAAWLRQNTASSRYVQVDPGGITAGLYHVAASRTV